MSKINITIPAYNEEAVLKNNIINLASFCDTNLTDDWLIVIANNNSNDSTALIGENLIKQNPKINLLNLTQKGKGLAIKAGWEIFSADYYVFMDADLATNLEALPRLIENLKQGNDVTIGSRKLKQSKTQRSPIRKIVGWGYREVIRILLNLKLTDFACGFKGINEKTKQTILPKIKDREWFFDTELLYLAQQQGLKIKEIPVQWTETPDLRRKNNLNVFSVGLKYLKAILICRITRR